MVNAYSDVANAKADMVGKTVAKVPALCFVEVTATTKMASVPATPVGRARSAASGMMNVKFQTAQAEDVA
jgi:hypothetical protein